MGHGVINDGGMLLSLLSKVEVWRHELVWIYYIYNQRYEKLCSIFILFSLQWDTSANYYSEIYFLKSKQTDDNNFWGGCETTGTFLHC